MLIKASLLCLALVLSNAWALNPPVPSGGKRVQQNQTDTKKDEQKAAVIQYGTAAAPAVVKILSPEITPEEASHHEYERHEKPTLDRWLTWGTVALAIITAVLSYFTYRLWSDARDTAAASVKDTQEALRIATQAANAATLSAKAAIRIELPVLRIIPPNLVAMDAPIVKNETYGGCVNDGLPTRYSGMGYFDCTNYGRTPAFPIDFSCGWQVAKVLPEPPTYIETAQINHAVVYRPEKDGGDEASIDAHFTIELDDQEIEAIKKGDAWLWFYGRLRYEDFLGDRHSYLFCWRWADRNPPSGNHPFYFFASDGAPPQSYLKESQS